MSAGGVGLIILLAKGTVGGRCHLLGIGAHAEAELLLESVALGEYVVAYLLGLGGDGLVDLAKTRLLLLGKADSLALESLEVLLQHHLLLAGEIGLVAVIDGRDPLVEGLVEGHIVLVSAGKGDGLLYHGIERVAAVGLGNIVHHSYHLGKGAAGEFERNDGVLEGRSLFICHDGIYLRLLLGYAGLDGRDIMGNLDFVEGRYSVRSVPFLEEGVGVTS